MNTNCEVNRQMLLWLQKLNVRLYLNRINKNGWGIIYIYFRCNGKNYRIPTNIKVMAEYWNSVEQRVILNYSRQTRLEYLIHLDADKHLNNILVQIFDKKNYYICNAGATTSIEEIASMIIKTISQYRNMSAKSKSETKLILSLKQACERTKKGKSIETYDAFINVFKKFILENSINDSLRSLNMDTMRKYRDWLVVNRAAKRGNDCLGGIFTLAKDLERSEGYDFNLDPKKIAKIVEPRTQDEMNGNHIALTHEEIEKMLSLELKDKEEIVRDLFIIQCWSAIRYEDLTKILDSKNFRKDGNLITSVFKPLKTTKHNITVYIPLNNPNLYPRSIELINKYIDTCPYQDTKSKQAEYNDVLRCVARKAGLNRIETFTEDKGDGKVEKSQAPICDKIASHDGRHSFVTNCIRYFHKPFPDIRQITGHESDDQIKATYDNSTVEDKVRSQNKRLSEQSHEQSTCHSNQSQRNRYPNSVQEAREILQFLGVETISNDIGELLGLIMISEPKILELCNGKIDILTIKDLFNTNVPLESRCKALKVFLDSQKGIS